MIVEVAWILHAQQLAVGGQELVGLARDLLGLLKAQDRQLAQADPSGYLRDRDALLLARGSHRPAQPVFKPAVRW